MINPDKPDGFCLTLKLLLKRNLPKLPADVSDEQMIRELSKLTHFRLDREGINIIDNLELCGKNITNLYLQHNLIEKVENIECLINLRFLTLAGNKISHVCGLKRLTKLGFLDLSSNNIHTFDIDEFPPSLAILSLADNPCIAMPDYRASIIKDLPGLRQLDGDDITAEEYLGAGLVVDERDKMENVEEPFDIEDVMTTETFKMTSQSIVQRSKGRVDKMKEEHQRKIQMLEAMRKCPNTSVQKPHKKSVLPQLEKLVNRNSWQLETATLNSEQKRNSSTEEKSGKSKKILEPLQKGVRKNSSK